LPSGQSRAPFKYYGRDVVKSLIDAHQTKFAAHAPHWEFLHADMCTDPPPRGAELLFCKDVFQHLPQAHIEAALKLISRSAEERGAKYLLCNTFPRQPDSENKVDIGLGGCNPRNLMRPPFSLGDCEAMFHVKEANHQYHKYLALWKLPLTVGCVHGAKHGKPCTQRDCGRPL
jgi:hypothetical protein